MNDLKVALVTAGNRGIGAAIVKELLSTGHRVVLTTRSDDDGRDAVAGLKDHDASVRVRTADVRSRDDVVKAVDACIYEFGRLDVAVANAGTDHGAPFLDITDKDWDEVIDVNLRGAFLLTQIAARAMSSGGRIVLIASTNAFSPEANLAPYNAAKAGVVGLMKSAALELAPRGITVNAVGPGLVETRMTKGLIDHPVHGPAYLQNIPLARFGRPSDIAGAVGFLASSAAGWITGHHLIVDGGQTIGLDLPLETVGAE